MVAEIRSTRRRTPSGHGNRSSSRFLAHREGALPGRKASRLSPIIACSPSLSCHPRARTFIHSYPFTCATLVNRYLMSCPPLLYSIDVLSSQYEEAQKWCFQVIPMSFWPRQNFERVFLHPTLPSQPVSQKNPAHQAHPYYSLHVHLFS